MAQSTTATPGKMPQQHDGMKRMEGMKAGPHQALAMAYGETLATFARAVQRQASGSKTVDVDLARPAVVEMRRSFDQMQQHHQAHMSMMGDDMKSTMGSDMKQPKSGAMKPMAADMKQMEANMATTGEHLTKLEAAAGMNTPSPKDVAAHAAEIVKHCAAMSRMHTSAKPSAAKPH